MNILRTIFALVFCAMGAFAADNSFSEHTAESGFVRIDTRTSTSGRLLRGTERVSPMAESSNANARLTVDGVTASGWSVNAPEFDAAALEDGWHDFTLNEGATTAEASLLALNDAGVAVHGGALSANETWGAGQVHIVRHWVRIPAGVTLTVEKGAIVKFCEATGIQNDGSLVATGAVFTSIEDDTAGGDTDCNGDSGVLGHGVYAFTGSGLRTMTNCQVRCAANLPVNTTWAAGSVNHVFGTLTVGSGVTLTIEPGAVVKFATGAELKADGGSIVADGALFTHLADDSEEAGGDTNGDGDATSPVHDAYKLTGFTPGSNCELRYITLTYTGGTISGTKILQGNRIHKVTGNITIASGGKLVAQPGAIVKMSPGLSITVQSGGILEALGNRAQPIVFTSIKDDAHGGDTNGDGNKTEPQPGDWGRMNIGGGTVNLNYAQIYYCGTSGASMNDAIYMGSGSCTLNNCTVAHVTQYVAGLDGGIWTMRNSVFHDFDTAFRHFGSNSNVNCVFYNFGNLTNNGSMNFINCIISNYSKALRWGGGNDSSTYRNCVIWNPAGFGAQSSVKAAANGNQWADPLFTNAENGDFTLKAGSPCIDAGDGSVAPELDYFGKPRMDVVKVADGGKPNAEGVCPDIGIFEMPGSHTGACANLAVTAVEGPAEAPAGEMVTVSWTIANEGNAEAEGPWRDTVTLMGAGEELGGQVVTLGEAMVEATLAPLQTITVTRRFVLPPVKPGTWRIAVTTNSYRDVYEVRRADNQACAEDTFEVSLPSWTAANRSFAVPAFGETGFAVPCSENAQVVTVAVPAGAHLTAYFGDGFLPNSTSAALTAVELGDGRLLLAVPAGATAPFMTLANDGGSAVTATVAVEDAHLALLEATPGQLLNRGSAIVHMIGTGFSEESAFVLAKGATKVTGEVVAWENPLTAAVKFELDGIAAGNYSVSVSEGGRSATLPKTLVVKADGVGPRLEAWLETPANVRDGRIYTAWLCYKNSGDADMTMPLFEVNCGASTKISYAVDGEYESRPLRYAGISPTAPAGVLKAGEEHRLPIFFTLMGNYKLEFATIALNDEPHEAFGTWREYGEAMAKAATRLNARGKEEYRASELFAQAMKEQGGALKCVASGTVRDQATGEAIPNTAVHCYDAEGVLQATAAADGDGWFVLEELEYGSQYSLVAIDCLQDEPWVFATPVAGEATGLVLPARTRPAVHGWVLDAGDGAPLPDMAVLLCGNGLSEEAVSDAEGHFVFAEVSLGGYQLRVAPADGYVGLVQEITVASESREALAVVELQKGGVLQGRLALQEDGALLAGVQVLATQAATGECRECQTDEAGCYQFEGLPPGRHWLGLGSMDYQLAAKTGVDIPEEDDAFVPQELDLTAVRTAPLMVVPARGAAPLRVSAFVMDQELRETAMGWEWDFDGDGKADSTEMDADWTYTAAGEHDVTLRYVDQAGQEHTMTRPAAVAVREPVEAIVRDEVVLLNDSEDYAVATVAEETVALRKLRPVPEKAVVPGSVLVYGTNADDAFYRVVTMVESESGGEVVFRTRKARLDEVLVQCDMTFVEEADVQELRAADDGWEGVTAEVTVANLGLTLTPYVKPIILEKDLQLRPGYLGIHFAAGLKTGWNIQAEMAISAGLSAPLFTKPLGKLRKNWVFMAGPVPVWVSALDDLNFVVKFEAKGSLKATLNGQFEYSGKTGFDFNTDDGFSTISERDLTLHFDPPEIGFDGSLMLSAGVENEVSGEIYGGLLKLKTGVEASIWGKLGKAPDDPRRKFSVGWSLRAYAGCSVLYSDTQLAKWLKLDLSLLKYEYNLGFVEVPIHEWYAAMPQFRRLPASGIKEGDTVHFFDESIQGDEGFRVKKWMWDFGDGTQYTCTEDDYQAKLEHSYEENGMYEASLRLQSSHLSYNGKYTETIVVGEKEDDEEPPVEEPSDTENGRAQQSCDPNEMAGMTGFGDTATQRFVQPGEWVEYTVYFENKSTAAAPAQEVLVTQQLSKWLDWKTLELGEIAFNNQIQLELKGKRRGTATVAQAGAACHVKMTATLDEAAGEFLLYLRSYDRTRQPYGYWPESVYAGFLPPNDDTHAGEGHFTFRVKVREDAPEGARIDAAATIVFDKNAPIATSPAWFNWVGAEDTIAATGYMTWDAVEGGTYEVSVWSGDPDPSAESAVAVASSGTLSENRWRLPSGLKDGVTYFWQVTTTDAKGESTAGLVYSFELGGRATIALEPGWNLLSLPFEPDAYSQRLMLGRSLFAVEDNAFVRPLALEMGRAYWLYNGAEDEPWLDFFPTETLRAGDEKLQLEGEWTMAGTLDAGTDLADYPEVRQVFEWKDGRYQLSDGVLEAGKGYWLGTGATSGAK